MPSALTISTATTTAPPAPRGCGWIDVETAARRSGWSARHITRLCWSWCSQGLARQAGGKWEVREDADVRFARVVPADAQADMRHLTDEQRKELFWKKSVLAEWATFENSDHCRGMTKAEVDDCFLELLAADRLAVKLLPGRKPPSDRTLRNWRKQSRGGLLALADGRSTRHREETPAADDPFFEFFKDNYLTQQRPDLRFCYKMACFEAGRRGWAIRSEPQTRRFVKTIPQSVIHLRRGGDKAYNDKSSPYIERDYTSLRVNQIVNADHHQFDVMVRHQGKDIRPWLTAFQDVRSRKILGWRISADGGNTETILAAMVQAMDEAGVPEEVYFDWGRDFTSRAVGGIGRKQRMATAESEIDPELAEAFSICSSLGIQVHHCQPYHGQSKPIERHFGTMRQFTKSRSTYCGNTSANKPENLPAKLARGAAPELADFVEQFAGWVEWHNECDEHQGDGMNGQSPAVVFDALRTEKRVIPDAVRTILFWKPTPLAKVGRNGVRCNRLTYELDPQDWMQWQGKQVSVRVDPADVNRAAICDPDGRFICIATSKDKLPWGATTEQKAAAIAAIKRRKKVVRDYHQARPKLANTVADEMWEQQAEESRRAREAAQQPIPLVRVSTPMDGQSRHIQRALQLTDSTVALAEPAPKQFDMLSILDEPQEARKDPLLEWCVEQGERDREERERQESLVPSHSLLDRLRETRGRSEEESDDESADPLKKLRSQNHEW